MFHRRDWEGHLTSTLERDEGGTYHSLGRLGTFRWNLMKGGHFVICNHEKPISSTHHHTVNVIVDNGNKFKLIEIQNRGVQLMYKERPSLDTEFTKF